MLHHPHSLSRPGHRLTCIFTALQVLYVNPYRVLHRADKTYTIEVHGAAKTVSIDHLKLVYVLHVDTESALPPAIPSSITTHSGWRGWMPLASPPTEPGYFIVHTLQSSTHRVRSVSEVGTAKWCQCVRRFGAAASKKPAADTVCMRRNSVACTYKCACVLCVCLVIHTYTTTPSFSLQGNNELSKNHYNIIHIYSSPKLYLQSTEAQISLP